ncbi:alpha-amylase family glycosyl hydrolase [Ichthyenterobacterium sp. W332]|uniref:Alpha-amylase family glycosyl hydrolase n=1 Tax=Microcosmobacter mediterraneus TaxID=3075607 RepID=A0ABU2YLA3_9FLAO|nr:alpha-amylase family glycosyl hydrolase [Ichthyenterobacterium sp. W332]MDT0558936.1 alpha-amylase family glycosyl hydrolase [Ichthyenterobacterium sp. W332]
MKKLLPLLVFMFSFYIGAQVQNGTFTINPPAFDEDEEITITVSGVDPSIWGTTDVYLWAWYFDSNGNFADNSPTNGEWTNSSETQIMTNNGDGTFSYTLTPTLFYGDTGISQIGMLVKAKDGTGDKKTQDNLVAVGRVRVDLTSPTDDFVLLSSGSNLSISGTISEAGSTTVAGSYEVFYNDISVTSGTCGFPTCNTTLTNITESGIVRFVGTPPGSMDSAEATFQVFIIPTVTEQSLPVGLKEGINYGTDPTKVTLVLNAPGKEFVQIAGSWNNYNPSSSDVMRRDPSTGIYWLEISGLTSGQIETYQYWVFDTNPIADSPTLVKAADPYSSLVLSPFDDPFIPSSTFPNLPIYPDGQEREVTVLQTGQTPYNWVVDNFNKPKEEDLIIYEVLVRDFDADRNYQDLIDRIDYFKDLKVNAIELMPVMEFEGNESWGYNTAFHMALDKFYGTPEKFKELVDVCHQNGIAVILDIAFNHAFGRNPLVRMWMDDPDGDGWGGPATNNPYFNVFPTHAFNVGSDFDHSNPLTRTYVKNVIQYWIEEYKIDGYRWDLTKGFTQNCGNGTFDGDFGCTQVYQQDRIDVLKEYVDHTWSIDPDHYAIFEHLGNDDEEREWANYRLNEGKGVMMWGKMTDQYNQLTMGFSSNTNFDRVGHLAHSGFNGKRVIGYPESHDEERLMYKNLEFGNNSTGSHNVRNLGTALSRMSALGAVSVLVPGPKMIWHFGALGMENSIFTCNSGIVNLPGGNDGDCKLDTKPQPQWVNNWLGDVNRKKIYDDWSRMHTLKINEPVFEGDYAINSGGLLPRIYVFDNTLPSNELRNVVILANFDVLAQNITPDFPFTGTWYDLMDESGSTSINVSSTTAAINLQPGEFRVYGNQPADALSINEFENSSLTLYPNPATTSFTIDAYVSSLNVFDITGKLVKSFTGNFDRYSVFKIEDLNQGVYLVKAQNNEGASKSSKLIKL